MQAWPYTGMFGWISTGGASYNSSSAVGTVNDCQGWTSNSGSFLGVVFGQGFGAPSGVTTTAYEVCSTPGAGGSGYPILCCD